MDDLGIDRYTHGQHGLFYKKLLFYNQKLFGGILEFTT